MKRKRIVNTNLIATGLLSLYLVQACSNHKQPDPITQESVFEVTKKLSSPEFNGRLAGSEGYNGAAQYVAEHFKNIGLENMEYPNYFQKFDIEYNVIHDLQFAKINAHGEKKKYTAGTDFICRGFSGSGDLTAPVAFCGYGISEPEMGYDDYQHIDVQDKVVMLFKYDPRWKINGERIGYNSLRKKAQVAKDHGAKGIIFISFPNDKNPQKPIGSVMHGEGIQLVDFPQVHIASHVATELTNNTEKNLQEVQTFIDQNRKPYSFHLNTGVHIMVDAEYEEKKKTMNVVGLIEGNDEKLKEEYLVIGAHLDHVGNQGGKVLFPGANDNASGVASVIHVAKALSEKKTALKRSVIFVAFSSEEQGLQGANYFVKHSPVPTDKIAAMMNMDCVAHGDSIVVGGGKSSPNLYEIARKMDSLDASLVINRTWRGGGADATPFFENGIPTLYFATKNSYTHLHLPTDTPETLNKSLHEDITELAYRVALEIGKGNYEKNTDR
jgi:hypothetical protein